MTARRSSATERRGSAVPPRRPTAILLAVLALATTATATGCASRPTGTQLTAKTLPGNQDTAAARLPGMLPQVPSEARQQAPQVPLTTPFTTASTSFPPPANSYPDDPSAWHAMATDVLTKTPPLHASPSANPADPKPRLEIITMPMWLWVDPVTEQTTVGADTVRVRTVADTVAWSLDNGAPFTCGGQPTPVASRGAGTPYIAAYDPINGTAVPRACITQAPATPFYVTDTAGQTVAGVRYYTAVVTWHAEYQIQNATTTSPWTATGPAQPAPGTGQAPLQFRVGEIQALVTGP